jgi:PAS domain S-box-containing protein
MVNLGIDVRLSKELFLEISNEINDLIFILDSGFNIEFVNEDVHLKLLGYSKEDLLYKKIRNFIDVKDFRKIKENIKTIDHNGVNSFDIQIFHKDGKKLWFEGKNKLFNSEKGKKRILLILKDVSERKQTELIVKESREKYQSIIKTINEGYYEVDLKGNFTFVSDALCKFIGYTQDELLGQNYEIVTDKKAGKLVYKTFNKVFRSEIQKKLFQFPVIKKNGEKAFFETSVYLKNERNGKKLGFYGIVRDITERKKEEDLEEKFKIELAQTVRLRTKELRESEEKYSNLFRHSNDGIFLHDLDGNIIDANQKVLEQFGYD